MTTAHRDTQLFFEPMSFANQHLAESFTGQLARYNGYSFTAGFQDRREFNPNTATTAELGQALATFIKDMANRG